MECQGLEKFKDYFKGYEDQYVLIGGAACDILFEEREATFRKTRDLDMVIIIKMLTSEFGKRFWDFVNSGKYRNKVTNKGKPQFYRFDKPEIDGYPRMIELFCREDFKLNETKGITPIHIDDSISSLSAILLNEDYYRILLEGRVIEDGLSVLRPEYLILFKAKAYLDLLNRKNNGEKVDSNDISKHKKDILRIVAQLELEDVKTIPVMVQRDIEDFISILEKEPFDSNLLKVHSIKNEQAIYLLKKPFASLSMIK